MMEHPDRVVLEGVPWIGFYQGGPRCPEDIPLPSVLRALTEYLGEVDYGCKHCHAGNSSKTGCSYAFFAGVTGAAFYLSWKEGWHGDNVAAFYLSDDAAAMEKNAFKAMGYSFEWLGHDPDGDDEATFRCQVIESIGRGMPVIGYGVVGPPEPAIIAGYDRGGDVLIGWSFFQKMREFNAGVEYEPSGYFRKQDWVKGTECLLIIGEKMDRPPLVDTYRDALQRALQVVRTPMVRPGPEAPEGYRNPHKGLAAYTAWAAHLLRDEDFPTGEKATWRQRYRVHNDAVGMVAEARWYGAQFLIEAVNHTHYSMAGDLLRAAACYASEHDLMWRIWDLAGGIDNPQAYVRLADPAVRRRIVPLILEARDKDAEAADHIERALAR